MATPARTTFGADFRHFFVRGLAIFLPTILTVWILIAAYKFVDASIAEPINRGVRLLVLRVTPWPVASQEDFVAAESQLTSEQRARWSTLARDLQQREGADWTPEKQEQAWHGWLEPRARERALNNWWRTVGIGDWSALDLIGLIIAVIMIYFVGALLGSYIGRQLYLRGEKLLQRLPLLGRVYPAIKQVTDFFVGDKEQADRFNRVVAVQYPRMGIWSIGLVTGEAMRPIQTISRDVYLSVFMPSSPTPFTGYVITVAKKDTIELPISIEEALRFVVSGGVVLPGGPQIDPAAPPLGEIPPGPPPGPASPDRT
ncbi:MAG: DUF502 domain-containing protein [Phycisphaeraceae bacterium]|nr:DUF502 domain-containing protein [Phycisphaeraceae bacterium]